MERTIKKTSNGLDKIMLYAKPRMICVDENSIGLYRVKKGSKISVHEAVRATDKDGVKGWVINMADRQRKFYSDEEVLVFPFTGSENELKDTRKTKTPLYPSKKVTLDSAEI